MDWLPGLDLSSGTLTLPLWAAGVVAALVVALIVIAVIRAGLTEFGTLAFRAAVVAIAVVLGWTYIHRGGERDRADERRALDARATELAGRALSPASTIACLEATSGDAVEGACERVIFSSPETLASAVTYVTAKLALLADGHDFATRRDTAYETSIAGLRRMIAADRFGLASQVLGQRDGCTADACDAFNFVYDDKKLRANLRERTYDQLVGRYAANWPSRPPRPLASATPTPSTPVTPPGPNVQFPSSQSIPPVSIMNNEPAGAPLPPPAAAAPPPQTTSPASATPAAPSAETKAPPRRTARPARAPSDGPTNGSNAPMSLAPAKQ